jgi:hypothetical protein
MNWSGYAVLVSWWLSGRSRRGLLPHQQICEEGAPGPPPTPPGFLPVVIKHVYVEASQSVGIYQIIKSIGPPLPHFMSPSAASTNLTLVIAVLISRD